MLPKRKDIWPASRTGLRVRSWADRTPAGQCLPVGLHASVPVDVMDMLVPTRPMGQRTCGRAADDTGATARENWGPGRRPPKLHARVVSAATGVSARRIQSHPGRRR